MSLPNNKTEGLTRGRWGVRRLYWRIWWLVVLVTTLGIAVVTALWRLDLAHDRASRPGAEIVVRDIAGHEIGYAQAMRRPRFGPPTQFQVVTEDGDVLWIELPPPPDVQSMLAGRLGLWSTLGWGGMVAVVGLLFMAAAFPLVRGLTRRLETLQQGVVRWGEGDLSVRLPVTGRDEVADLARQFNAAADQIQALVESHKYLLAHASHELRSPLARIRMALALMPDTAEHAATKDEVQRNVAELDQLVEEVLLASRLEHNPDDTKMVDAIDLLGMAAEECARVDASLSAQQEVAVRGNAVLLRRMLRNLLENARRHGGMNGDAHIEVSVRLLPSARPCIEVADRGPGIPEAWRERVFDPFVRVLGAHEKHGSVGLGLALVRLIAERHGAHVSVHAREGGGSVFVVKWL